MKLKQFFKDIFHNDCPEAWIIPLMLITQLMIAALAFELAYLGYL